MSGWDIHVLKYFSSFVSVSNARVINVSEPKLAFCPLAGHLYKSLKAGSLKNGQEIKKAIKKVIEYKIKHYGFFTDSRKISYENISIPYGASEMISFSLKKHFVEAAVVVCEGAGTVVVEKPEIVQGIGARMNTLLLTSPIKGIINKLNNYGCKVIFENAVIDQLKGVMAAVEAGYKVIAVTIQGNSAEDLKTLRLLEKENNVKIISLVVCTTGISEDKIKIIGDHADLVWSCASFDLRRIIGPLAKFQFSRHIPVFVLSGKGVEFVSAYAKESELVKNLDTNKQYIFSFELNGQPVHLGNFKAFFSESQLPVVARKEPSFKYRDKCRLV
jgi:putative methanogenesis marker protein 8